MGKRHNGGKRAKKANNDILQAYWEYAQLLYRRLWYDGITSEDMIEALRLEDEELYEMILDRIEEEEEEENG